MAVSLCFYHASFMCSLVLLRDFGKTLDIQYHLKVFSVIRLRMPIHCFVGRISAMLDVDLNYLKRLLMIAPTEKFIVGGFIQVQIRCRYEWKLYTERWQDADQKLKLPNDSNP